MNAPGARGMVPSQAVSELVTTLDEAMDLLREFSRDTDGDVALNQTPASLLQQCLSLCAEHQAAPVEPVRTLHHFACTGGALIGNCIAAMPNTQVMSDVDPLSTLGSQADAQRFAPTDMIERMRRSSKGVDPQLVVEMFLGNLDIIRANAVQTGQRLVLRDHAHSHFCSGAQIDDRPTLRAMVASRFPVSSVVIVRDPVESYLSLRANQWVHFEPRTFDEYCRRYLAFLLAYEEVPIVKYEAFAQAPHETMSQLCKALQLSFSEQFSQLHGVFAHKPGAAPAGEIEVRPRKNIDAGLRGEMADSPNYRMLQSVLGYS